VQHNIILSDPSPTNSAPSVEKNRGSLSVLINHKVGGLFNYSITTNPDIGSASAVFQSNETKTCAISDLSYGTSYSWIVSVQELDTGNWTNETFMFTTESTPTNGGGGSSPPPVEESPVNMPPEEPVKPSGPLYIEPGINYVFQTVSFDTELDRIRYQFDWGDGTHSGWSDYVDSNQIVSMVHHWQTISNFTISVLAQDEQGLNSTWSEGLTVVCKTSDENLAFLPMRNFTLSEGLYNNQSIQFNASLCVDPELEIILYSWDFGDGTMSTSINPVHVYDKPGVYKATLMVTDDQGNSYSKTMVVTIQSQAKSTDLDSITQKTESNLLIILIPLFSLILLLILVIIRKKDLVITFIMRNKTDHTQKSLFDEIFISDTFLDGLRKLKNISDSLLNPQHRFKQTQYQNISMLEQKNENKENDFSSIELLHPIDTNIKEKDIEPVEINTENVIVDEFFGKYSYDYVKKHVDSLLKNN
jgi:hypothetical protein